MEPNFFIVGAPKAGTTSLFHYLDQHPQIFMSSAKEPCCFASEVRPENFLPPYRAHLAGSLADPKTGKRFGGLTTTWSDYVALFKGARDEVAVGEASVCYLWSPTVARNPVKKCSVRHIHFSKTGCTTSRSKPRKRTLPATMSQEDRRILCEYYREDVLRLSSLLDRDLTPWLV